MDFIKKTNDILKANGYKSKFIPSYGNVDKVKYSTHVFHHIKKCGGMSIHSSIALAIDYHVKLYKLDSIPSVRLDNDNHWRDAAETFMDKYKNQLFISSHNIGSYYNRINAKCNRFTVLRDPFDRAKSFYQYQCMRKNAIPDLDEFQNYLFSEENQRSYFEPFLLPESPIVADSVIDLLERDFISFFELNELETFLSAFISKYGLPNILMGKQNATLSEYSLNNTGDIRDKYYSQLTPEKELFDWVQGNKRMLNVETNSKVNEYTIILHSKQTDLRYEAPSRIMKTSDLFKVIMGHKTESGLDIFFPS